MITGKRYQFDGFIGIYSCKVTGRFRHPYLWEVVTRDSEGNSIIKHIDPITPEPKPIEDEVTVMPLGGTTRYKNNPFILGGALLLVIADVLARIFWQ